MFEKYSIKQSAYILFDCDTCRVGCHDVELRLV